MRRLYLYMARKRAMRVESGLGLFMERLSLSALPTYGDDTIMMGQKYAAGLRSQYEKHVTNNGFEEAYITS